MSDKKRAPKKVTIDYKNGKIYKILNDVNDMIYIGSTTQTLSRRLSQHKRKADDTRFHTALKELGADRFRILLIELFSCTCKAELEAREYAVMNEMPTEQLYNTRIDGKHSEESKKKMSATWTSVVSDGSVAVRFWVQTATEPRAVWRANRSIQDEGVAYAKGRQGCSAGAVHVGR